MLNNDLKIELFVATSPEEVRTLLSGHPEFDVDRVYQEIAKHRLSKSEKLDLSELDSVSGGADRDWIRDGCASTYEYGIWCWSNDRCLSFDVTYDGFWAKCPDGQDHVFSGLTCTRCGFVEPYEGYVDSTD